MGGTGSPSGMAVHSCYYNERMGASHKLPVVLSTGSSISAHVPKLFLAIDSGMYHTVDTS